MSSIRLGIQLNELEARIVTLEAKVSAHFAMILTPHALTEERLAQLESMVAMMRHAIDVAVLAQAPTKEEHEADALVDAALAIAFPEVAPVKPYTGTTPYMPPEDPFPINDSPMAPVKPAKVKATRA